jgi:hypothetical protein
MEIEQKIFRIKVLSEDDSGEPSPVFSAATPCARAHVPVVAHRRLRAVTVVSETYRSSVVGGDDFSGLEVLLRRRWSSREDSAGGPHPLPPSLADRAPAALAGGESTGGAAATPSSFRSIGWGRADQARVDLSFSRGGAPSSHAAASTSSSEARRRRARARAAGTDGSASGDTA